MVIDPSSGYNKGGISNATSSSSGKVKSTAAHTNSPPAQDASAQSGDSVSLSDKAQTLARLEAAVAESPDTNEAKVAAIKSAVDNGTYEINARSIADKMLEQDQHL